MKKLQLAVLASVLALGSVTALAEPPNPCVSSPHNPVVKSGAFSWSHTILSWLLFARAF